MAPGLIPNLPDDLAYRCLLRVPLAFHGRIRGVCRAWRDVMKRRFYEDRARYELDEEWICAMVCSSCCGNRLRGFFLRSNVWCDLPAMSSVHRRGVGMECRVLQGKVFICGGYQSEPLDFVSVFDPCTNRWSSAAPMLSRRAHFASGILRGRLYVVGGNDGSVARCRSAEYYDPGKDRWHWLPPADAGLSFCVGLTVDDDRLFVKARGGCPSESQVFSEELGMWSSLETALLDEASASFAVLGDRIYRLGRRICDIASYDWQTDLWVALKLRREGVTAFSKRWICDAVACSGKLCAVAEDFSVAVLQVDCDRGQVSLDSSSFEPNGKCGHDGECGGVHRIVSCHVLRA